MPKKFTLTVEEGDEGLWYITSSDVGPGKSSLFVAEKSLVEALAAVPECMADLARAQPKS
jgi:hypothetical protein